MCMLESYVRYILYIFTSVRNTIVYGTSLVAIVVTCTNS